MRGLALIAPHFIVEDISVASIAEIRTAYETTDLKAKLARWHKDVDNAFYGWNGAWLDPKFRNWDISEYLAYIRVPVAILQGVDDQYGTMRQVEIAQEECYCPVDVTVIPGAGHSPHREAPEATLDAIAEFANARLSALPTGAHGGLQAIGPTRAMSRSVPFDEHETKCMFRRFRLDLIKNMHYCASNEPSKSRENDRGWLMAGEDRVLAGGAKYIDFQTDPSRYRHWKLGVEGDVATLTMDVDENAGLFEGYQLKLNSYDLGVDIELADAVQRLRFEHPEVKVVVMRSGKNRVFCAGANIRMLAGATHAHKVNFCKFTNETRNGLEDSSENSGQRFITVVNGTAAGGGYELALATDHIMLADDGAAAVSLPEVPLLAVLPGTGGLTRVVDKRKVRRDHADFFCTIEEGIKGKRAVAWRLVDEIVAEQQARSQGRRARQGIRRRLEAQRQRQGHHACAAQSHHRRQRHPLRFCQCRHRPRGADRDHLDQGAGSRPARRYRRPDRAGRVVLAAAGGARAR